VERRALRRVGWTVPLVHQDDLAEIERVADLGALRAGLGAELKKLSQSQRAALQLRVVEELPYHEVARRLGTTEPAARARVSRALRVLALALEPARTEGVRTR
jgi:RNA polymerase sigma factor (sigma-70 family)